jgi:spermidine/putrescine transport system permease protein
MQTDLSSYAQARSEKRTEPIAARLAEGATWRLGAGEKTALPVLIFLFIGFAAPLLAVIWYSFMPPRTFSFTGVPTLQNYRTIFQGTSYISFLWSLGLAALTTATLTLICYPVSYALVRVFGKYSMLLTLLFTIPLFVSENIRLYGWVLFFIKNGVMLGTVKAVSGLDLQSLLFTRAAVIFGMVYVYIPFMLFPLTLGISMVPTETRDAAFDLGASRWQVFREVELPLSMPGILIGSLLTFVLAVGAIAEAKVLGGQKIIPITHDIEIAFTYAQNWPLGAALAVLLMAVVGALVLMVLRRFDLDLLLGKR